MKNLYYDLPYEIRLLIDEQRKYLFKKRINDMNNKLPKGFFAWGNLNGKHRTLGVSKFNNILFVL